MRVLRAKGLIQAAGRRRNGGGEAYQGKNEGFTGTFPKKVAKLYKT